MKPRRLREMRRTSTGIVKEADMSLGNTHFPFPPRVYAELGHRFDMSHTLHCLVSMSNNLQLSGLPTYFWHRTISAKLFRVIIIPQVIVTQTKQTRLNTWTICIDQIPQYIMCSGDMTAIGTRYYPGLGKNYVYSDEPHTCRDFEKLQDWMVDRYDGPGAVLPAETRRSHS